MEYHSEKLKMTQEWETSRKFGVVVFVLDQDNRVLVLREKEEDKKTGRKIGDYSVICEKRRHAEAWLGNINRGLNEELGIDPQDLRHFLNLDEKIVWETGFVKGVWATAAVIRCNNPQGLLESVGKDRGCDGVEIVGWKTLAEFKNLSPIREGVLNILNKFEKDIFLNNEKINLN